MSLWTLYNQMRNFAPTFSEISRILLGCLSCGKTVFLIEHLNQKKQKKASVSHYGM